MQRITQRQSALNFARMDGVSGPEAASEAVTCTYNIPRWSDLVTQRCKQERRIQRRKLRPQHVDPSESIGLVILLLSFIFRITQGSTQSESERSETSRRSSLQIPLHSQRRQGLQEKQIKGFLGYCGCAALMTSTLPRSPTPEQCNRAGLRTWDDVGYFTPS